MKIIIDNAIPFIRGVLEPYAGVIYLPGREITAHDVRDADALVIRTRTRCNASLLEGSRVRFIATATIGFDHIDLDYCRRHDIGIATAAGCNARGVLQWIGAVLTQLVGRDSRRPEELTLGIVGAGHVGELIRRYAVAWGFRTAVCDPPRARREADLTPDATPSASGYWSGAGVERIDFLPLEEVARRSDFITFHTPLDDSTRHLVDDSLLGVLKPDAVVINSSRGEVVDGEALLRSGHPCVLDVWEHEPEIDRRLLGGALIATPHIAGYSIQGKANATAMAVAALARQFDLPLAGWYPPVEPSQPHPIGWEELAATIAAHYDIEAESRKLKLHPERFEELRNRYAYREEYF